MLAMSDGGLDNPGAAPHESVSERAGMKQPVSLISLVFAVLLAATAHAAEPDGFHQLAQPFVKSHCIRCHDARKHEGDLRLDLLSVDYNSPKILGHWEEIMQRINSGDMPPKEEPRPKPENIARLSEWIVTQLHEAEARRQTGTERIAFRKLTREEYANTIRDLLGVTFDVKSPNGLPEDPDWHGFERIGSVLTLAPAHGEPLFLDHVFGGIEDQVQRVLQPRLAPGQRARVDRIEIRQQHLAHAGRVPPRPDREGLWRGLEGAESILPRVPDQLRLRATPRSRFSRVPGEALSRAVSLSH